MLALPTINKSDLAKIQFSISGKERGQTRQLSQYHHRVLIQDKLTLTLTIGFYLSYIHSLKRSSAEKINTRSLWSIICLKAAANRNFSILFLPSFHFAGVPV